jgi:hypothetical protein
MIEINIPVPMTKSEFRKKKEALIYITKECVAFIIIFAMGSIFGALLSMIPIIIFNLPHDMVFPMAIAFGIAADIICVIVDLFKNEKIKLKFKSECKPLWEKGELWKR